MKFSHPDDRSSTFLRAVEKIYCTTQYNAQNTLTRKPEILRHPVRLHIMGSGRDMIRLRDIYSSLRN